MKRGDVYYVKAVGYSFGDERSADRLALIVSNDKNNTFSNVVEIVYLTSQEKKDLPTHVKVRCKGVPSTVMCEQINSIAKSRLTEHMATLTPSEMQMVDIALSISIGVSATSAPPPYTKPATDEKTATERDLYKRLHKDLLEMLIDR